MQLNLLFPEETTDPMANVWRQIPVETQKEFVEALARTIAKAVRRQKETRPKEQTHDR